MEHPTPAPAAVTIPVTFSEIVSVNLLPAQQAVQIFYRPRLAIAPSEVVIPWLVVKGLFKAILELELAAQGSVVSLTQQG